MSIDQNVSHPSHYGGKDDPYETIKVIDAWGLDKNFCLGNVIKYISRAGKKDGNSLLQDLMKAQFYLNYEIEKQRRYDVFKSFILKCSDPECRKGLKDEDITDVAKFLADWFSKYAVDPVLDDDDHDDDEVDDCECKDHNDCDNSVEYDGCPACSYRDDCGVHTISVPDDVGDAINKVADYFLDSEDDYEIGITDDGALVIAPSDYDCDSMEADDEECD